MCPDIAQRPEPEEKRSASEAEVGAEGQRARHVEPVTNPGIEQNWYCVSEAFGDCRKRIDRRDCTIELAASVVTERGRGRGSTSRRLLLCTQVVAARTAKGSGGRSGGMALRVASQTSAGRRTRAGGMRF